ncbi:MAG: AAA family ATPase [Candidatus Micrarchaeia archaeon]
MIVERRVEAEKINSSKKWVLVYGRRKTGKSFLVEKFVSYDEYFFVNRDRTILSKRDNRIISYDAFVEILLRELSSKKCVVVDEFHRLGEPFFDLLHAVSKDGKLIAITSTLNLAKKLVAEHSSLLGYFNEIQIPIISLDEVLEALTPYGLANADLLEVATIMREPIAIDYFDNRTSARETIAKILMGSKNSVPALFGEIFIEEEKSIAATYEGIVRSVAGGKVVSGEIASSLFSKKLIPKDDPSIIQPYLNTLINLGILRRIKVFGKNKNVYKIASPLMRLFFYADEKYGISMRDFTEAEAIRIVDEIMPRIVEDAIREELAHKFGLAESVLEASDYDVDGLLLRFNKPEVLLEVKWGKRLSRNDITGIINSMKKFDAKRKFLFVRDKKGFEYLEAEGIKPIDVESLKTLKPS